MRQQISSIFIMIFEQAEQQKGQKSKILRHTVNATNALIPVKNIDKEYIRRSAEWANADLLNVATFSKRADRRA